MNINNEKIFNKNNIIACKPIMKEPKIYRPKGFLYNNNFYALDKTNNYVLANNMFTGNIKYEGKTNKPMSFNEVSALIL